MDKKIDKKLLSNFNVRIGLLMFLLLLPLKNVYADGCDHSYENIASVAAILMIVVALIIFTSIFTRGKELLVKVIVFCMLLLFFYLILYFSRILSCLNIDFIISLIILSLIILIIFLRSSKKEKDIIKKYVFLFFILFFMFILFLNGNKISNFYTSATCESFGGELKLDGYCDTLYCKMPKK